MKVHKPTITDFTDAQHSHETAAQGGTITGAGFSGYSGWSGTIGDSGAVGATGYSGLSGIVGATGATGSVGSGYSGFSGLSGIGYSGLSGASGFSSALAGQSGGSGYSGFSGKAWAPAVTTITSDANPTIDTDSCDSVTITALATNIASFTTNLAGTPANFQKLIIRIKDDGTARTLAWGTKFIAKGVSLPTTTVISKLLTIGFIYDTVAAVWGCVAKVQED